MLDASVILKWLLRDPQSDPHTAEALALMEAIAAGEVEVLQPTGWRKWQR